uniref:Uncharacterized protein n=1 Tax=Arundo donax TaxID=35708 RepID=A0A0A8ZKF4_ARUDO
MAACRNHRGFSLVE